MASQIGFRLVFTLAALCLAIAQPAWAEPASTALVSKSAQWPKGQDVNVYVTPENLKEGDILQSYSLRRAEQAKNRPSASAPPGLIGIANQAARVQKRSLLTGTGEAKAYSLADAMRDAIWRKKTSARLNSLFNK